MKYAVDKMYEAVVSCDDSFDGEFYYAVKTVGVYCRPSCRSRTPLRKNVEFFETSDQAQAAGYRPCKRCRPDLLDYAPALELATQTKEVIDGYYSRRKKLSEQMRDLGVSQSHVAAIFKRHYGMTPIQYLGQVRLEHAKQLLINSDEQVAFIAYDVGFDSLAAFYRNFKKHIGISPSAYRKANQR
jgi:AraC family transcriptional regulator of adaptative response / methylphosphotriester-DNA alkyltransferase methyltransferase